MDRSTSDVQVDAASCGEGIDPNFDTSVRRADVRIRGYRNVAARGGGQQAAPGQGVVYLNTSAVDYCGDVARTRARKRKSGPQSRGECDGAAIEEDVLVAINRRDHDP